MAVIDGTPGNDVLNGTPDNDDIFGFEGDDIISGLGGRDIIRGGPGNDIIDGGEGSNDTVFYTDSPGPVIGDLAAGYVSDGFGTFDKLISIERLVGSAFNDVLLGDDSEFNSFSGEGGDDYIDGRGGIDFVWYGRATQGVYIDLEAEFAIGEGTDTLISIEEVAGSNYSDTIYGSSADNWFRLDHNDDEFTPNRFVGGADFVDGRGGFDTVYYGGAANGVFVNLDANIAIDGRGSLDTLISIEEIRGSDFDDILLGADGVNNRLFGNEGNDYLVGGNGDNLLNGGDGNDFFVMSSGFETFDGGDGFDVVYLDVTDWNRPPITVIYDLVNGINYALENPGDRFDVLIDIEGLSMVGALDVQALGNDDNNFFSTGSGNDLHVGGAGADYMDAGDGSDWVSYAGSVGPVAINLFGFAAGGDAEGDTLINFENIIGSDGDDFLVGNNDSNFLVGGDGIDSIDGGMGSDTWSAAGGAGGVTVYLFLTTDHVLDDGFGNTETLVSIENVLGSDHSDAMAGDGTANVLTGGLGEDFIYAGAGDDTIVGGAGADVLQGDSGIDVFSFSATDFAVAAIDWVVDFTDGVDVLQLQGFLMEDLAFFDFQSGLAIYTDDTFQSAIFLSNITEAQLTDQIVFV